MIATRGPSAIVFVAQTRPKLGQLALIVRVSAQGWQDLPRWRHAPFRSVVVHAPMTSLACKTEPASPRNRLRVRGPGTASRKKRSRRLLRQRRRKSVYQSTSAQTSPRR